MANYIQNRVGESLIPQYPPSACLLTYLHTYLLYLPFKSPR